MVNSAVGGPQKTTLFAPILMSTDPASPSIVEPCGLSFAALGGLPDTELMAHLQAGHGEALAVLFDRFHRLVLSVAHKILGDGGEAEDLLQTVFIGIYKRADQYDPNRGTVKMWLLQHAYHRSISRRQYLKSRAFYDQTDMAELADTEKTKLQYGPCSLSVPETRSLIRQGLKSLSARQKRTLHLAYFEGMSLKEISEATGESLGNVRHHYYRGLRHLRVLLLDSNGKSKAEPVNRGVIDVQA
jgi:RNA polymerase sigma-70 factor (ECF subfamily)